MNIALDYDDTYTKDPLLWNEFIGIVKRRGHTIFFCTCRGETDNNEDMQYPSGMEVFFTNGEAKKIYMQRLGIRVDIWIDDMPEMLIDGVVMVG